MKTTFLLSLFFTLRNTLPSNGRFCPAPSWDFQKAAPKLKSMPMTSPVDFISGPRIVSTPKNLLKGKTDSLTAKCFTSTSRSMPRSFSFMPGHELRRHFRPLDPVALLTKGTVLDRPGVHLQHVHDVVLDGVLDIHEPDYVQLPRQVVGVRFYPLYEIVVQGIGGQGARAVA